LKVLHIITGLNVGGAEAMLARLIDSALRMPGVDAEIISLMVPGVTGQRLSASGATVHTLGMRSGIPSVRAAIRLAVLVRRIRPDVIMGWMHHGQIAASWATLLAPRRPAMIWNIRHSLNGYDREKPLSRLLLRIGARLSGWPQAIVYNSMNARRQYRLFGYCADRDLVIPNGFDRSCFAARKTARPAVVSRFNLPAGAVVIGMLARNHAMKDVPNLVAAFARVRAHRADAHLLVVGEGMNTPEPMLAARLAALPAGSWTLSGHRTDVTDWLAGLDIVALSSAWGEGFPNVIGEAMAAGVPCVATNVGDSAWAIGPTGRVVPAGDSVALAEALLDLVALDRDRRQALGKSAARRIDEHFTLNSVIDRYATQFAALAQPLAALPRVGALAHAGDGR
jgi:glycosyltransferase involved in cell wall biosynthesis